MSIWSKIFKSHESKSSPLSIVMDPLQPNWTLSSQFGVIATKVWRQSELVYACVHRFANTASQVSLRVFVGEQEVLDHPLSKLLKRPNPYMGEYDLWYSVLAFQKLAGIAAFEKVRNRSGQIVALYPLRPDWLRQKVNSDGKIVEYTYAPEGVPESQWVHWKSQDVLTFPLWDPLGLFQTFPPVAVASKIIETDYDISSMIKSLFQVGGTSVGILTTKTPLTESQAERIRARWQDRYGGWRNWFVPAILDGDVSYQRISSTLEELKLDVVDARIESRICAVLEVPPILVGAKVGLDRSTFSNYQEARKSWWQDTLMPAYRLIEDNIQNQLASEFGPDVYVEWDFSRVPAMQEDENQRWERALRALDAGAITVNEFREMVGLKRIPNQDVFLRQQSVFPTKDVGEELEHKSWDGTKRMQIEHALKRKLEKALADFEEDLIRKVKDGTIG